MPIKEVMFSFLIKGSYTSRWNEIQANSTNQ